MTFARSVATASSPQRFNVCVAVLASLCMHPNQSWTILRLSFSAWAISICCCCAWFYAGSAPGGIRRWRGSVETWPFSFCGRTMLGILPVTAPLRRAMAYTGQAIAPETDVRSCILDSREKEARDINKKRSMQFSFYSWNGRSCEDLLIRTHCSTALSKFPATTTKPLAMY